MIEKNLTPKLLRGIKRLSVLVAVATVAVLFLSIAALSVAVVALCR